MNEDPPVGNIASSCWFFSTAYWARSFTFRYGDWLQVESMISTGAIVPDQDGNVTICTPQVFNLQELYVLESQRINGGPPTATCNNQFPKVPAQVWVLDGLHGGPPPHVDPPDCDKELLHVGTFSFLTHCLAPPPNCTDAQVWITFNVECMRQAILWWRTNYGDNCVGTSSNPFALQCSTWLFNVGMLTCQNYQPEEQ